MEVLFDIWVGDEDERALLARGDGAEAAPKLFESAGAQPPHRKRRSDVVALRPWLPKEPQLELETSGWGFKSPLLSDNTPLEWPSSSHRMLEAHPSRTEPNRPQTSAALALTSQRVQTISFAVEDANPIPTLTNVSPLCVRIQDTEEGRSPFILSGRNLGGCQILARLQTGRILHVEQDAGSGGDSIAVTVHGLTAPGCLLLECRSADGQGILSHSRAVLVVDSAAMRGEVCSMEDEEEPGEDESGDDGGHEESQENAIIRDLGSWLEFCHQATMPPSGPAADQGMTVGQLAGREELQQLSVGGAAAAAGSLLQLDLCRDPQHRRRLLYLGAQVLEYAVDSGWSAVASRIVEQMIEIYDMSIAMIFEVASSDGLPLVHRYRCPVRS